MLNKTINSFRKYSCNTIALFFLFTFQTIYTQDSEIVTLQNQHIQLSFKKSKNKCSLYEISRADYTDKLTFDNHEFEILLLNNERLTIEDYRFVSDEKTISPEEKNEVYKIKYKLHKNIDAPSEVTIIYELGTESFFRKQIIITSDTDFFVDRLQVQRLVSEVPSTGGGLGQPVYVGKWFFGMDYPGFYSWHNNNFSEPAFNMRVPYNIDLVGRDREFAAEEGLINFYHFPGYSEKISENNYKIISKQAVVGISFDKSKNADFALLDYINNTRLKPKSFLHFNNWYSIDAKKITIQDFVKNTYLPIKKEFDKYDVKLDAMVPDHGWQDGKFSSPPYRVYSQKKDGRQDDLHLIGKSLQENGTNLGIWLAFDGRNQDISKGIEKAGYKSALSDTFDRKKYRWTAKKDFFDMTDSNYLSDLKESINYLINEAGVNYFKHDFNHMFTSNYITERHAREKCLDITLELMEYERLLNPDVFLNFTNGSWFSPFWFQHVHTLWMMSGDSGGNGDYPQLSLREGATTYRDKYFYDNFRLERIDRPVIPIADFMTHGILYSKRKPFTNFNDIIDDWANYVVMYYARGTTVKELYITHDLLSEKEWEVLGKATKWAVENQENLLRTVFIGGDPSKGEAYGYISWNDNKAILTVRNPQRLKQSINIPFDQSVYYSGKPGESFKAKCIYPFVEQMPWKLNSGEVFSLEIPGDCVQVFEIEKGETDSYKQILSDSLPEYKVSIQGNSFEIKLNVPDKDFRRLELIIESLPVVNTEIKINNEKLESNRNNTGKKWKITSWELNAFKGKEISINGIIRNDNKIYKNQTGSTNIYLLADQKVKDTKHEDLITYPLNIMQGYRRATKHLLKIEHHKD